MLLQEVGMRIGELARLSGVRPATLRYYERRGLVSQPARTAAGYRSYTQEAAAQLRLIGWAKGLGFTLREIREMTGAIGQHAAGRGDRVRTQVRAKIAEVDHKMSQLAAIRAQLEGLAACRCKNNCPVIERVLAGPSAQPKRR
jgi:MerR family mercuric resistance operon transcriptional regulator